MVKEKYEDLLRHYYWGSFDSGVIFIFLSLMIWDETENMMTVALAFSIPIVIDTIIDYFFSSFSDVRNRKKLIIIGNIGSAIALSFYGLTSSLAILYSFIKGVSEKTYGFNRGMNRVSDAHFFTQLTALVFPEILFQSPLLPFSKEHLDEKSVEHTFFFLLKNPVIPCLTCHNHV